MREIIFATEEGEEKGKKLYGNVGDTEDLTE